MSALLWPKRFQLASSEGSCDANWEPYEEACRFSALGALLTGAICLEKAKNRTSEGLSR